MIYTHVFLGDGWVFGARRIACESEATASRRGSLGLCFAGLCWRVDCESSGRYWEVGREGCYGRTLPRPHLLRQSLAV